MNSSSPDRPDRFVVARFANGGIGDHLSCLMGAWWFAVQTGRTLIIDWRGSRFNRDPASGGNCITDFFEVGDHLAGVRCMAGDEVARLPFSDDAYPPKWHASNLAGLAHVPHSAEEVSAVNALVGSGHDRPERWVAFNQWIDPPPPRDQARRLLSELRFAAPIRAAAGQWFDAQVGSGEAVAIHIRHGNGENIGSRAAYWLGPWRFARQAIMNARADMHRPGQHGRFGDNMPESLIRTEHLRGSELAFLERVRDSIARMRGRLGEGAVPVLFCDAPAVVDTAKRLVPDLLVPPKTFLPPNGGPLHATSAAQSASTGPSIGQVSFEMCVEMELMRRCSALICMSSGFSIFSRVLLDPERIEMLEPPWANRCLDKALDRLPLRRGALRRAGA